MIGRLKGVVDELGEDEAVIDVAGVGYVVRCGSKMLSRLGVGEAASVFVETQWAEQTGITLYGFLTREERAAFVTLKTIQGVGPKAALAVLDVLSPAELDAAVAREDRASVARANGVGPKLALRIITELKGKPLTSGNVIAFHAHARAAEPAKPTAAGEAVAALMGLQVAEPAARRAVEHAAGRLGDAAEAGALIKAALQELGR
jgi:Holliday junction DNA helicase RuvA